MTSSLVMSRKNTTCSASSFTTGCISTTDDEEIRANRFKEIYIFPLLAELARTVQIPRIVDFLKVSIESVQMIIVFLNLASHFIWKKQHDDLFNNPLGVNNSKYKYFTQLSSFNDFGLMTKIESGQFNEIFEPYLVIFVYTISMLMFSVFTILSYKNKRAFSRWHIYVVAAFYMVLNNLVLIPTFTLIGYAIVEVHNTSSVTSILCLLAAIISGLVNMVIANGTQRCISESPFLQKTLFASWDGQLMCFIKISCCFSGVVQSSSNIFSNWFIVFCVFVNFIFLCYLYINSYFLHFLNQMINVCIKGMLAFVGSMQILLIIHYFVDFSPLYVIFLPFVLCLIVLLIYFREKQIFIMKHNKKLLYRSMKKTTNTTNNTTETTNSPSKDSNNENDNNEIIDTSFQTNISVKMTEEEKKNYFDSLNLPNVEMALLYLHVGLMTHAPLFIDFSYMKYLVENVSIPKILFDVLRIAAMFPAEQQFLAYVISILAKYEKEINIFQAFVLYQVRRINIIRQSSVSKEARNDLKALQKMSEDSISMVRSFWSDINSSTSSTGNKNSPTSNANRSKNNENINKFDKADIFFENHHNFYINNNNNYDSNENKNAKRYHNRYNNGFNNNDNYQVSSQGLKKMRRAILKTDRSFLDFMDKYPNSQEVANEYCRFLIDAEGNFSKSMNVLHKMRRIENGKQTVVDYAFRCFVNTFPNYLSHKIVDMRGHFIFRDVYVNNKEEIGNDNELNNPYNDKSMYKRINSNISEMNKPKNTQINSSQSYNTFFGLNSNNTYGSLSSNNTMWNDLNDDLVNSCISKGRLRLAIQSSLKLVSFTPAKYSLIIGIFQLIFCIAMCLIMMVALPISGVTPLQKMESNMYTLKIISAIQFCGLISASRIQQIIDPTFDLSTKICNTLSISRNDLSKDAISTCSDQDLAMHKLSQMIYDDLEKENHLIYHLTEGTLVHKEEIKLYGDWAFNYLIYLRLKAHPNDPMNIVQVPLNLSIRNSINYFADIANHLASISNNITDSSEIGMHLTNFFEILYDSFLIGSSVDPLFDKIAEKGIWETNDGKFKILLIAIILMLVICGFFLILRIWNYNQIKKGINQMSHLLKTVHPNEIEESLQPIYLKDTVGRSIRTGMTASVHETSNSTINSYYIIFFVACVIFSFIILLTCLQFYFQLDFIKISFEWAKDSSYRFSKIMTLLLAAIIDHSGIAGLSTNMTNKHEEMRNHSNYIFQLNRKISMDIIGNDVNFDVFYFSNNKYKYTPIKDPLAGNSNLSNVNFARFMDSISLDNRINIVSHYYNLLNKEYDNLTDIFYTPQFYGCIFTIDKYIFKGLREFQDYLFDLIKSKFDSMNYLTTVLCVIGIFVFAVLLLVELVYIRMLNDMYAGFKQLLLILPPESILKNSHMMNYILSSAKSTKSATTKGVNENKLYSLSPFETIIEETNRAILNCDENFIIQSINPSVQKITGFTPDQVLGQSLTWMLPCPNDDNGNVDISSSLFYQRLKELQHGVGEVFTEVKAVCNSDSGEKVNVKATLIASFNDQKNLISLTVILADRRSNTHFKNQVIQMRTKTEKLINQVIPAKVLEKLKNMNNENCSMVMNNNESSVLFNLKPNLYVTNLNINEGLNKNEDSDDGENCDNENKEDNGDENDDNNENQNNENQNNENQNNENQNNKNQNNENNSNVNNIKENTANEKQGNNNVNIINDNIINGENNKGENENAANANKSQTEVKEEDKPSNENNDESSPNEENKNDVSKVLESILTNNPQTTNTSHVSKVESNLLTPLSIVGGKNVNRPSANLQFSMNISNLFPPTGAVQSSGRVPALSGRIAAISGRTTNSTNSHNSTKSNISNDKSNKKDNAIMNLFRAEKATVIQFEVGGISEYVSTMSPKQLMKNLECLCEGFSRVIATKYKTLYMIRNDNTFVVISGLFTNQRELSKQATEAIDFSNECIKIVDEMNEQFGTDMFLRIVCHIGGPIMGFVKNIDCPIFDIHSEDEDLVKEMLNKSIKNIVISSQTLIDYLSIENPKPSVLVNGNGDNEDGGEENNDENSKYIKKLLFLINVGDRIEKIYSVVPNNIMEQIDEDNSSNGNEDKSNENNTKTNENSSKNIVIDGVD